MKALEKTQKKYMKLKDDSGYTKSYVIILQDTAFSMLATLLATLIVRWLSDPVFNFKLIVFGSVLTSAAMSLIAFLLTGTHKVIVRHASMLSMNKFILASFIKVVMLGAVYFTKIIPVPVKMGLFIMMTDFVLMLVIIMASRIMTAFLYDAETIDPDSDIQKLSVMICGAREESVAINSILGIAKQYNILGFLTMTKSLNGHTLGDKKVFGFETMEDLEKICWNLGGVDCVIFPDEGRENNKILMEMCLDLGIQVMMFPKTEIVSKRSLSKRSFENLKDLDPNYISDGMSKPQVLIKRLFDICLSGFLLLIFSPLFLICWIAIKLDDHGPAIYRQERLGKYGKPFHILKFRSMKMNAESAGPALYSGDEDPRLTKVGKFLRQHHLDELPQLWNVFRGDMSFIGYRPERQFYIDQIMEHNPRYKYLYQIRPGVTSYATLYNGYTDTIDKMLRRLDYDLYYLSHRSIGFDLRILWNTFTNIVFGKIF